MTSNILSNAHARLAARITLATTIAWTLACGGAGTPAASSAAPKAEELRGRWLRVEQRDGKAVVDAACTAEAPSFFFTEPGTLSISYGQDGENFALVGSAADGATLRLSVKTDDGEEKNIAVRWDGPEHRRLLWERPGEDVWETVHEERLGDVVRMKACCLEVEGELPEDYATVPEGQPCPPEPTPTR